MTLVSDLTTKPLHAAIYAMSRASHGVLWTGALRGMGATKAQIQGLVDTGFLRRAARGVFVVAAVPHSWEQDLMIECRRAPGRAWVAGEAAAALLSLDGCRRGRIVIATTANLRSTTRAVRFRRVASMPATDTAVLRALPITTVDRTLMDLGEDLSADRVELAYECAFRRGLTHPRRLKRCIEMLGTKGRKGPSTLRWIIEVQGDEMPTGSALEVMFLQLNRGAGFPKPIRQRVFRARRGRIVRVDFLYPGTNVIVEVDGRSFHVRRLNYEDDLARRNGLTARGFRVLNVTFRRMKGDPEGVVADIAETLGIPLVVK